MINLNMLWIVAGVAWAYKVSFFNNRKKLIVLIFPLIICLVNYMGIRMVTLNSLEYMSITSLPEPMKISLGILAFFAYSIFLNIILSGIRKLRKQ